MTKISNLYALTNYVSANSSGNVVIAAPSSGYALDVTGTGRFTGALTLNSTITNGTYTYTLPGATGTLALTSALSSYLPLSGGTLTGALSGTSATFSSTMQINGAATGTPFGVKTATNQNWRILDNSGAQFDCVNDAGSARVDFRIGSQLYIASSGNVGIGTTSPLQTATNRTVVTVNGTSQAILNFGISGTLSGYIYSDVNNYTELYSVGQLALLANASQPMTFNTQGAERMRITSAGNLGIGTTSPTTYSLAGRHLELNDAGGGYAFYHCNTTSVKSFFATNESLGLSALFTFSNHPLTFGTNNTERMRITNTGAVGINVTAPSNYMLYVAGSSAHGIRATSSTTNYWASVHTHTSGTEVDLAGSDRSINVTGGAIYVNRATSIGAGYGLVVGSDDNLLQTCAFFVKNNGNNSMNFFNGSGTYVASISINASTVTYGTGSDYRLKEDYRDFNGLDKISAIKVYDFKFKAEGDRMEGVIAHELQEVIPYAVNGEKDAINDDGTPKIQNVDYSKLVPILIKSIQELSAKVTALENK